MNCALRGGWQLRCGCARRSLTAVPRRWRSATLAASEPSKQPPKQEAADLGDAVIRSLSELSKNVDGTPSTTKMVIGNDQSVEAWRKLDIKVNRYPMPRSFTAIGLCSDEYQDAMKAAVEAVLGPVHVECVNATQASKKTLVKVTIGPVMVQNSDQVIQVYEEMRKDPRTKLCM